MTTKSNDIK